MPELQSLGDRLHYDGSREYTKKQGNVAYLDDSGLRRPFTMPRAQRVIALVFVVIAALIGFVMINNLVISKWADQARTEQAITANMQRQPSIETIPDMASLIALDNEAIKAGFQAAGYSILDTSSADNPNEMTLYKVPSDMTVDEAAALYKQGVGSLSAEQASKLLVGSWYFAVDRAAATSLVVRYADFSVSDPQIAVQNALKKQGFDPTSMTDSGVDDSGNTYASGKLDSNGVACTWKISALPLDDMYSISGMGKDACYVGIRVTAA